jgi:hypothetical protein
MKRLLISFAILTLTAPLQAQVTARFDTARMQRDLDIMNAILDRLVFQAPSHFIHLGGESTKGIYLPDYGVIFLMPQQTGAFHVWGLASGVDRRRAEVIYKKSVEREKEVAAPEKVRSRGSAYAYKMRNPREMKEPLLEFFAKYADAIGQLDDSEKIAVYASGGAQVFFSTGEGWSLTSTSSGESAGSKDMLAVVRKADIIALRTGKLQTDDFNDRVAFRDLDAEATSSEIDIMARIIDTALQGRSREPMFRSGESRGIYLDGYGVIFFTNATFGQDNALHIWEEAGKREGAEDLQRRIRELQTASTRRHAEWVAEYKKFKQQLGEVIVDYGHTLRQIKPQDHIVVTANLENAPEEEASYLVCRVKKQNVDAFNARRISREQLLKQIAFMEY